MAATWRLTAPARPAPAGQGAPQASTRSAPPHKAVKAASAVAGGRPTTVPPAALEAQQRHLPMGRQPSSAVGAETAGTRDLSRVGQAGSAVPVAALKRLAPQARRPEAAEATAGQATAPAPTVPLAVPVAMRASQTPAAQRPAEPAAREARAAAAHPVRPVRPEGPPRHGEALRIQVQREARVPPDTRPRPVTSISTCRRELAARPEVHARLDATSQRKLRPGCRLQHVATDGHG